MDNDIIYIRKIHEEKFKQEKMKKLAKKQSDLKILNNISEKLSKENIHENMKNINSIDDLSNLVYGVKLNCQIIVDEINRLNNEYPEETKTANEDLKSNILYIFDSINNNKNIRSCVLDDDIAKICLNEIHDNIKDICKITNCEDIDIKIMDTDNDENIAKGIQNNFDTDLYEEDERIARSLNFNNLTLNNDIFDDF